jgi:type IV pilus assembly protein PilB
VERRTGPPIGRRRSAQRVGELLISGGFATDTDVERALVQQRETGAPLGAILAERGVVSEQTVGKVLAFNFSVDFVDLDETTIDPSVLGGIKESFARRHRVLPVAMDDETIVVAMADPTDVFTIDDVAAVTSRAVCPVFAESGQLTRAIDRVWGSEGDDEILRIAEEEVVAEDALSNLREVAEDAPVIQFVNQLLTRALNERASDLHLEPSPRNVRVRFRIDGVLKDVMTIPLSLQPSITSRLKLMGNLDIAERRIAQDGRLSIKAANRTASVRRVTLPTNHGEALILRILEETNSLLDLDGLGFAEEPRRRYEEAMRRPWGAILVTGPTGSGKSTTLYATLADLNDEERNIVTVEDPIEYQLDGIKQVQLNNKAGMNFAYALRAILRSDPDVVLVGEIRDLETAKIAVEAALTGHLMLTTLHTNNAASAPMRLVDMGVEPFLVTSTLSCVVAQRLARRLCDRCKKPYKPSQAELREVFGPEWRFELPEKLYQSVGCTPCSNTGYRGRAAVQEVMTVTEEMHSLILERATSNQIEALALEQGMLTMREDGLLKATAGVTSVREVLRAVG